MLRSGGAWASKQEHKQLAAMPQLKFLDHQTLVAGPAGSQWITAYHYTPSELGVGRDQKPVSPGRTC